MQDGEGVYGHLPGEGTGGKAGGDGADGVGGEIPLGESDVRGPGSGGRVVGGVVLAGRADGVPQGGVEGGEGGGADDGEVEDGLRSGEDAEASGGDGEGSGGGCDSAQGGVEPVEVVLLRALVGEVGVADDLGDAAHAEVARQLVPQVAHEPVVVVIEEGDDGDNVWCSISGLGTKSSIAIIECHHPDEGATQSVGR